MVPAPTPAEQARRDEVAVRLLNAIRTDRRVKLPDFDASRERPDDRYALLSVGIEPNEWSGTLGPYRYQFEGEEDLLHLIVTGPPNEPVSTPVGQAVAEFVLAGVPSAFIWLRPGEYSQHFYVGHDELIHRLQTPVSAS